MTKRAAIYLRISLDATGEGLAIARQRDDALKLVEARGWTVAEEYIDNSISASNRKLKRPAYDRMVEDYSAGKFEAIVCYDLDRLTRQPRQLEDWIDAAEERGLALVTTNGEADLTTDGGRLFARIKAAVAKSEVERKSARQKAALKQRANLGLAPKGTRLTGYTTNAATVPDEAARVRALFDGFAAGETLRGLATTHDLTPSTVRTILTNPRYAGRRVYGNEVVAVGNWEAIISEPLFDLVGRRLADPARITNRTGATARKHLGTSLFECGECDDHPTLRTAGSGGRYWCSKCGLIRTMAPVDELVLAVLYARLSRPDARTLFESDVDLEPLQDAARDLRERRIALAGLVADGTLSAADVKLAAASIAESIAAVDREIAAFVAPAATSISDDEIEAGIDALSLDRRRALIASVMSVRLLRGGRGSRTFNPETVTIEWKSATT